MLTIAIALLLATGCSASSQILATSTLQSTVADQNESPMQTAIANEPGKPTIESGPGSRLLTPEAGGMKGTAIPFQGGVQSAVADLAQRLGVEEDTIEVIESVPDEFPAGDLGCPDPKTPTRPVDAFVAGERVILRYAEDHYEYHVHAGRFAFCDAITKP